MPKPESCLRVRPSEVGWIAASKHTVVAPAFRGVGYRGRRVALATLVSALGPGIGGHVGKGALVGEDAAGQLGPRAETLGSRASPTWSVSTQLHAADCRPKPARAPTRIRRSFGAPRVGAVDCAKASKHAPLLSYRAGDRKPRTSVGASSGPTATSLRAGTVEVAAGVAAGVATKLASALSFRPRSRTELYLRTR